MLVELNYLLYRREVWINCHNFLTFHKKFLQMVKKQERPAPWANPFSKEFLYLPQNKKMKVKTILILIRESSEELGIELHSCQQDHQLPKNQLVLTNSQKIRKHLSDLLPDVLRKTTSANKPINSRFSILSKLNFSKSKAYWKRPQQKTEFWNQNIRHTSLKIL